MSQPTTTKIEYILDREANRAAIHSINEQANALQDTLKAINELAALVTKETQERLIATGLGCEVNPKNAEASFHVSRKYTRLDIGYSGRYMIENETGRIYGIKAYGVPNKKHYYGTLGTITDYYWGGYRPQKRCAS